MDERPILRRRFLKWRIAALALLAAACGAGALHAEDEPAAHRCSGAGKWFPADPKEIETQIESFAAKADVAPLPGRVRAIVAPHAGYEYSGPTAARSYKIVRGEPVKRVIVLAFSHSHPIEGASVLDASSYETPLGSIPVDREVVQALLKSGDFKTVASAHESEHSDENQLPFLQWALGKFKIVSILVGQVDPASPPEAIGRVKRLADAIRPWVDNDTLLVVSSDFTHYGAAYGYAPFRANPEANLRALEGEAAYYLLKRKPEEFLDYLGRTGSTICGSAPLSLMLQLLGPQAQGVFLHYERSKDPSGSFRQSVGYMALAFVEPDARSGKSLPAPPAWICPASGCAQLNEEEKKTLLRLARESVARRLEGKQVLGSGYEITPRLMAYQGAFVTLTENGNLRGCIGNVDAQAPLYLTVARMAQEAAFGDPRFAALTADELAKIHIEISALLTPDGKVDKLPTKKLDDVSQIRLGVDGLTIRKGLRAGLLLPQVPAQFGWDRDAFLLHLCEKAGLPPSAWREAQIERFSAQIFGEQEKEASSEKAKGRGQRAEKGDGS